jgi:hypothetical protein
MFALKGAIVWRDDECERFVCAMSHTITLEVSDALMERARTIAQQTSRQVADVLAEWLTRAAATPTVVGTRPIEALPDEQVLALRDLRFPDEQRAELSDLLADQREGQLTPAARA